MSNIREVLDDLFSQAFNSGSAHQIPDETEMIDEAELAINKIFKENYKRLALDVIGEAEPNKTKSEGMRMPRWVVRNVLRNEQTEKLMNQLNNMKGE